MLNYLLKKSAPFWLRKGYFLKWGITIKLNFLRLATEYFNTLAFLSKLIVPIPPKSLLVDRLKNYLVDLILFEKYLTTHPVLYAL